ncbi:MAG: VWA domain-containing protein, partial [Bacillota bacterium]|nr:VWA domain-containing protein [Bacillota bacterium]
KAIKEAELTTLNLEELLRQAKVSLSWFMVDNALSLNDLVKEQAVLKKAEKRLRLGLAAKAARGDTETIEKLLAEENLLEKDFHTLSPLQIKAMEQKVEKLGRKLGARYSYRLRRGKSGIIDMRRVMGETAKRGFPTDKMHYLTKVRNKPSLVILCDISGSMAQYSRFFLQLVYAMEKRFKDIQSYLFIDNVVECNFPRNSKDSPAAIAAAILEAYVPRTGRTGQHCTTTGISDYGKAFHFFLQKFPDSLEPHKTLLILGDAKNNWFPANKENLAAMSKRVKEVIWLNPQPRSAWNSEDSIIGQYAPYCTKVEECRNLQQLTKIAETL